MSSMRLRRLVADYEAVRRLARLHPRVEVEGVEGNPPERYVLTLEARSLRETDGRLVVAKRHRVEVTLPLGYPRDAPLSRMLTPVFHPNVAPHAICIGDDWSAAEGLDHLIQRIGEILCFQSYNVKSPLNGRAARWVEENESRLPLDPVEFYLDLAAAPPPTGETAPEARCENCGTTRAELRTCPAGHRLCPECSEVCPSCGRVLCVVCGAIPCPVCNAAPCANCGRDLPAAQVCSRGHPLCADCACTCDVCGKELCLVCGEIEGHVCATDS
jgi:ubiquitin-protein ligase